jgi:hypothetical protein
MRRWRWVLLHDAVVVVLAAAVAVLALARGGTGDADIGLGLLALPLMALGLPWSLLYVVDPYRFDDAPYLVRAVVAFGPAFLNVLLHAAGAGWWRRRRGRIA